MGNIHPDKLAIAKLTLNQAAGGRQNTRDFPQRTLRDIPPARLAIASALILIVIAEPNFTFSTTMQQKFNYFERQVYKGQVLWVI